MTSEQRDATDANGEMSFAWALLSYRGQRGIAAIAGILLRHAIPLVGVLILHWSAQKFLLLAVINFAWNWTLLGGWNSATDALLKARRQGNPVAAGAWILMLMVGVAVFLVVALGFGFPVYFMSGSPPLFDVEWSMSVIMSLLAPLPNLAGTIRQGVAANLTDEQIQVSAKSSRQLLLVGVIPIVAAYGLLASFPYPGMLRAVAVGYVLFSALCELRPDLAAAFGELLPRE